MKASVALLLALLLHAGAVAAQEADCRAAGTEGYIQAVNDLTRILFNIRFERDEQKLRKLVETGRIPGVDEFAQVEGMVAGARLLELQAQPQPAPTWRP